MNICSEMLVLRADSTASIIVQWDLYSQISLPTLLSKHGPYSLPLPLSALNPVALAALQWCLKIASSYSACYWISWPNDHEQLLCQYTSV